MATREVSDKGDQYPPEDGVNPGGSNSQVWVETNAMEISTKTDGVGKKYNNMRMIFVIILFTMIYGVLAKETINLIAV